MKTTIDVADNILERARAFSKEESISLKVMVEEGLKHVLETHGTRKPQKVRPVTFNGEGLSPEFAHVGWSEIRDAAYQGRGA